MIVEDFVMLGTTVPEPRSDGRIFVCSAGWSEEMGQLLRVYPLARRGTPRRWRRYRVPLERNPRDARRESWALRGNREPDAHARINSLFAEVGTENRRSGLLDRVTVGSIKEANERRLSLCVLLPKWTPDLSFDFHRDSDESPQLRLFDDSAPRTSRFPWIPRLSFHDEMGDHALMLRDWGAFEFMRRYGYERRHELGAALHLRADSALLVGNMNHQRNAWLVISVLNGLRPSRLF